MFFQVAPPFVDRQTPAAGDARPLRSSARVVWRQGRWRVFRRSGRRPAKNYFLGSGRFGLTTSTVPPVDRDFLFGGWARPDLRVEEGVGGRGWSPSTQKVRPAPAVRLKFPQITFCWFETRTLVVANPFSGDRRNRLKVAGSANIRPRPTQRSPFRRPWWRQMPPAPVGDNMTSVSLGATAGRPFTRPSRTGFAGP